MPQFYVDPMIINYSQTSVHFTKQHVDLAKEMSEKGWNDKYALNVITLNKNMVSLDNRRLFLARALGLKSIKVNVHDS